MRCGKSYGIDYIVGSEGIPTCSCGGAVKPDVVLYEESLDEQVISGAVDAISNADMLIVAGTSLRVYPAAGFIRYFKGDNLVLINRDSTPMDDMFGLVIKGSLGDVMSQISV